MTPDPSLVARIWDWFWAVGGNWYGLVGVLSLATGFSLNQLFPGGRRQRLRRGASIVLCLLGLLISCFQVYDDVSTRLRRVSSELPDFNKVTTWSVSFQTLYVSEALSSDIRATSFILLHKCRFVNLSNTRTRALDIKIIVPTNDPEIPVVTLDTENMLYQEYRKSFTDKGLAVDASAGPRGEALLETPINLEPNRSLEGTIGFDIYDENVKRKRLSAAQQTRSLFRWDLATVTVTDHLSEMTKTIRINQYYNAATESITRIGEHNLPE
jgi:hypothetical protein